LDRQRQRLQALASAVTHLVPGVRGDQPIAVHVLQVLVARPGGQGACVATFVVQARFAAFDDL
jgi:hypothetical protein